MIYLTGDTHGEFKYRFTTEAFPEQRDMTKEDVVIICGDFGGIWEAEGESRQEKYWLDWFEDRSFSLVFIDGNHENFERIYSYPEKEGNGGRVHEIRPHVLHLCRGQVFEIDSKTIFTFGGAASHDIAGGILEPDDPDFQNKKKLLNEGILPYRINHISWWEQEMANVEEMEEGLANLARYDNKVDYIVTHCCSSSTQDSIGGKGLYAPDRMTDYFEKIKNAVTYKKWFFGHYHMNMNVNDKEILIYEQLIRIS